MEKLNEFIIRQLNDKKTQRWIIKAVDLFELCNNMGIIDDDELMMDTIDYLDKNKIDVNFSGGEIFHKEFVRIENKVKFMRRLEGSKTEAQRMIEKIESIKVTERPDWLKNYMVSDEEENKTVGRVADYTNQYQRITDMLYQKLQDQVENESTPTIDELIKQLENAPEITEEQINEIRNNVGDITGEGF